jgi:hypothetical protein
MRTDYATGNVLKVRARTENYPERCFKASVQSLNSFLLFKLFCLGIQKSVMLEESFSGFFACKRFSQTSLSGFLA